MSLFIILGLFKEKSFNEGIDKITPDNIETSISVNDLLSKKVKLCYNKITT